MDSKQRQINKTGTEKEGNGQTKYRTETVSRLKLSQTKYGGKKTGKENRTELRRSVNLDGEVIRIGEDDEKGRGKIAGYRGCNRVGIWHTSYVRCGWK